MNAYSGQPMDFKINNHTKMRLASNGYLGIGTDNPTCALDVNGDARFGSMGNIIRGIQFGIEPGGNITGTVTFPNAFPTGSSVIVFCSMANGNSGYLYSVYSIATSTTTFNYNKTTAGPVTSSTSVGSAAFGSSEGFYWLAIAY